jgi:hypothetical protein
MNVCRRLFTGVVLMFLLTAVGAPSLFADIVNGDFELGNVGFTSGYTYHPLDYVPLTSPGIGFALWDEGTYTVTTDPKLAHGYWTSFGDHTTGSGQMMVVNGDETPNTVVWSGQNSVPLAAGWYTFSAYVASLYPISPAQLTFSVDGQPLGTTFSASDIPGKWLKFSQTFEIEAGSPTFSIVNLNTQPNGNDFAIDDIHLHVPEAGFYSAFALNLGGLLLFVRRRRKA